MWWIIGIIVLFIFIYLADILKVLKNKDPLVQEERIKKQKLEVAERYELISNLKKNIGNICTIKSSELIYVNEKLEITGKILAIDEDWIELEYIKKASRKKEIINHLIFKTSSIESFSILI